MTKSGLIDVLTRQGFPRLLLTLPVIFAISLVVPLWAACIYAAGMGWRS